MGRRKLGRNQVAGPCDVLSIASVLVARLSPPEEFEVDEHEDDDGEHDGENPKACFAPESPKRHLIDHLARMAKAHPDFHIFLSDVLQFTSLSPQLGARRL